MTVTRRENYRPPTHPQRFVIPDKRSADPEPMPWTVARQIGRRKKHLNAEALGGLRKSCAIKRNAARTAHNAHFTHIHTSTMTTCKAHIHVPRGLITSP
jgi:hypothetical protein